METTLPAATLDLAAPTDTTPKLRSAVQDRAIEQYIKNSAAFLEEVRTSPTILERMTDYGFGDEEISVGMSLLHEASHAYHEQLGEIPKDLEAATDELEEKIAEARDEYICFRLVARAAFTDLNDRVNLRVLGDVPDDLQRFINKAHLAYTAGGETLYAEKISKRGYPAERLAKLNESLDALTRLDATHDAAEEAAAPAPETDEPLDAGETIDREGRDAAYIALKEFMKEIKGVARAAFRRHPDVLERLKLND